MIHPTAIVDAAARVGPDVAIGPYSVVDAGADLGPGVVLGAFVRIHGCVRLGARTRVMDGSVLGGEPQDVKYQGEATRVEIGADARIHEHVTVHRATKEGVTRIGDGVMLMAGSHVGHNCVVGDRVILTNDAKLGGHAVVGERAILSASTAVHQFCRVGRFALLAGGCMIGKDAPPFSIVSGQLPAAWRGINTIGLRRAGFDQAERTAVRAALLAILGRPGSVREVARAHADHPLASVREIAAFVLESKRGVVTGRRSARAVAEDAE